MPENQDEGYQEMRASGESTSKDEDVRVCPGYPEILVFVP